MISHSLIENTASSAPPTNLEYIVSDVLPCSIGIGTNKMIAKIASNLAKPEGIVSVEKGGEKLFLEPVNEPAEQILKLDDKETN